MSRVTPFGATSLHDAIAQTAERVGDARGPPPRGRRAHRRQRQREPARRRRRSRRSPARSTCRSTSSASCRRSTTRPRTIATPSAEQLGARAARWPISRRGPAATCSWRARRRSAASRRGRSSTSCGTVSHRVRIERQAGLAPARGPRTRQGPRPFEPGVDISRGNLARHSH